MEVNFKPVLILQILKSFSDKALSQGETPFSSSQAQSPYMYRYTQKTVGVTVAFYAKTYFIRGHIIYLENTSVTFNDKVDPSDLVKRKNH